MKRILLIPNTSQTDKYYLKNEYSGFGIYQRKTVSGFFVSQDFAITNGIITIVSPSFNSLETDDLKDSIDEYVETGKFNLKAFNRGTHYIVHVSGKAI